MPLPKESTYTIDDIYALPDGERAELIDGHIYYMAPPSTRHQRISSFISWKISEYIHTNQGACEVFAVPFAVHLDETNNTYVEPDISVICNPNKLNDKGCIGSPDWIVDPSKNQVVVYNFEHGDMEQYTLQDSVKAGIYKDLSIDFSQINL